MNLRQVREAAGIPREKAAYLLEVSTATLGRWEKDTRAVPAHIIPKMKKLYSLTGSQVLSLLDSMKKGA